MMGGCSQLYKPRGVRRVVVWVQQRQEGGMPRAGSMGSAIEKTVKYLRRVQANGEVSLKFTNYESKNCIIYKLNKYHYLDTELYVIDMHALRQMARLFAAPNNVELIHLDLCNIGDPEATELTKANWNSLRFLSLSNNHIKHQGLRALVGGRLEQLRELNLSDNGMDGACAEELARGEWRELEKLHLSFNCLGSQGLVGLEGNRWRKLKVLGLLSNAIDNRGAAPLVRMRFPVLEQLLLSHNHLTDDSAQVLVKGYWPQLKVLDLDGNFLGDGALRQLWRLGCYKLQRLNLFDGKTVIINGAKDPKVLPTMGGLRELARGSWERVRVEIHLGKLGEISRSNFIRSPAIKHCLERAQVDVALLSLGKSNS